MAGALVWQAMNCTFLFCSKSFAIPAGAALWIITFFPFFLSKPMKSTLASLKLTFQQLPWFSSRVEFGAASSVNSLSWISPCELEDSF